MAYLDCLLVIVDSGILLDIENDIIATIFDLDRSNFDHATPLSSLHELVLTSSSSSKVCDFLSLLMLTKLLSWGSQGIN